MKHFEVRHSDLSKDGVVADIEKAFTDNRKLFESYGEDANFNIKNGDEFGIGGTYAVDIDRRTLFYTTRYFTEEGFKPEWAMKSILHELEHIREIDDYVRRKGNSYLWKNHQRKLLENEAYKILDNCYDDVKMDASVEKRAPVLKGASKELCLKKQFVQDDLRDLPKHLQFAYSLKRELITGEKAHLDEDVRAEFDKLRTHITPFGEELDLLEIFSRPDTPFEDRVAFQEKYLRPVLERFLEDDKSDERFKKGRGDQNNKGSSENNENPNDDSQGEDSHPGSETDDSSQDEDEVDFSNLYQKYWEENPSALNMDPESIEKLVDKIEKDARDDKKDPMEKAFDAYAKREGVSPRDLQIYRNWKQNTLEKIVDIDTGNLAITELREQIKRIVKSRIKNSPIPVFPQDEGDLLVLPADAYIELRSGETKPKVWEEQEIKKQKEKKVSNFDIHVVCDTSGSMQGEKLIEQRKAAMLLLEAMNELYEELDLERLSIEDPLSVRTECVTFGSEVSFLKNLDEGLSEKERVGMYKALSHAPGSTKDYLALQSISSRIDKITAEEIKNGDRKKIVIVMTDGGSDNSTVLKSELKKLRDTGTIVVGVAITSSAKSAIQVYAPESELAENASDLPSVFKRILDRHLDNL